MPRPQRCTLEDIHSVYPSYNTHQVTVLQQYQIKMAASSIDASLGDSSGKFDGLLDFPDTMGPHPVHLHYPSGNPHDGQAVYVDSSGYR
jgi:hypothetical protein